jgi:iron complex outermembrane receptor protein
VPVTVAALSEADLKRYNITTITEAAMLIPKFQVFHGGSGNGASIVLRGIGSSSISAAFDQSVAINVDGLVVSVGRFVHNAYLDMGQLEVLKGAQSLYFGKSATAGVVSITSTDPGKEFEFEAMLGYESEYKQQYYETVISGPIIETFGARLAVGKTVSDQLFKNLSPGVYNKFRGEESTNTRLTLVWEPTDRLKLRLKHSISGYDNDGANGRTEEFCPGGSVQPTAIPLGLTPFTGVDDCKLNGQHLHRRFATCTACGSASWRLKWCALLRTRYRLHQFADRLGHQREFSPTFNHWAH